jgi:hypothetical protein
MFDLMSDPNFRACRDERCKVERVHAEHASTAGKRGAQFRCCPLCRSPLMKLPHKRAACSNDSCNWRGSTKNTNQEPARA